MKKLKLFLCALTILAITSCSGAASTNTPESTVKGLIEKMIEINVERREMIKEMRAGIKINAKEFQKRQDEIKLFYYYDLLCYEGERVNNNNNASDVDVEIYTIDAHMNRATSFEIAKTTKVDDVTAVVKVSFDKCSEMYLWVSCIEGEWLIETADTPDIKKYMD